MLFLGILGIFGILFVYKIWEAYQKYFHVEIITYVNPSAKEDTKLYIIIHSLYYKYLVEYIRSITQNVSHLTLIQFNYEQYCGYALNKLIDKIPVKQIIFHHLIPKGLNPPAGARFLNTEQLSRKMWLDNVKNMRAHNMEIIDYSFENVRILKEAGIPATYVPYAYYAKEIYTDRKTKNVCMIDSRSTRKRSIIHTALSNLGIPVTNIQGFKLERDKELFKHKILLNIHNTIGNDKFSIFEEIRCTRCIFNKMIVITEESDNIDAYMYRKHIIVVPYNQLAEKTIDVLANYSTYYVKLFPEDTDFKS
jgi:hypothetical protein